MARNALQHLIDINRFGNDIVHARAQALFLFATHYACRHRQYWDGNSQLLPQDPGCSEAIHDRHLHIHQDQGIVMGAPHPVHGFLAIVDYIHVGSYLLQYPAGNQLVNLVIFDKQHADILKIRGQVANRKQLLEQLLPSTLFFLTSFQYGIIDAGAGDRLDHYAVELIGERLLQQALLLMQASHGNQAGLRPTISVL